MVIRHDAFNFIAADKSRDILTVSMLRLIGRTESNDCCGIRIELADKLFCVAERSELCCDFSCVFPINFDRYC